MIHLSSGKPARPGKTNPPPIPQMKRVLEKEIEKKFCKAAEKKGWFTLKFTGHNGVPDRICLKNGKCVFIEFKQRGGLPRPLQSELFRVLREAGFKVLIIDDLDHHEAIIDAMGK